MKNQYNKSLLITQELEWYEEKTNQIRNYIEGINLATLTDRIEWKPTSKGGVLPMVIASKEAQAKSFMEMMEKLPKILNALDELRNKYAEKEMLTRGDVKTKNTGIDFAGKINKDEE